MAGHSVMVALSAMDTDLFGEVAASPSPAPKKLGKPAPAVPKASPRHPMGEVPHRPCTVTKLGRCQVMVVNDDCAHQFR